jgi:chromosome segregation ATPase
VAQCVTLQSELKATQARLRDVQQERDRYYNELAAAETRLDRARSKTLNVLHKSESDPQTKSESADTQTDVKTEGEREEHKRVSPPAVSGSVWLEGCEYVINFCLLLSMSLIER